MGKGFQMLFRADLTRSIFRGQSLCSQELCLFLWSVLSFFTLMMLEHVSS